MSAKRFGLMLALLVGAVITLSAPSALASPFGLESAVGANLGCNPTAVSLECLEDVPVDERFLGASGAYVEHSWEDPGFVDSFATAEAYFGDLRVFASAEYNLASPDTRFVMAVAQAHEDFTPLGGPIGTAGFLDVEWTASGSTIGSAAGMFFGAWHGDDFADGNTGVLPITGPTTFSARIPVEFGQEFILTYLLLAAAGTPVEACSLCDAGVTVFEASGAGSGTADFAHSLLLTSLILRNSDLTLVENPRFLSGSGTRYGAEGVVVPEPASLLLVGTGLVFTVRRLRRVRGGR